MASKSTAKPQRRRKPKRSAGESPGGGDNGSQYHSKAIARALDVLECFNDEHPQLSLKDIAGMIELPESSLFRILLTLESRHYLVQNPDGAYELAPRMLFGTIHDRAERVRHILHPYLEELARRFNETASSAYLFEDRVHALDTVESFHEVRMTNRPGRVLPPHASSLGKAIVAFQPPPMVDRMLEAYGLVQRTEFTLTDRQALLDEYAQIRTRGYAIDRGESVKGGICIGAPVVAEGAPVMAAISVSTPLVRMWPERELEVTRAVLDVARQAAREMRGR
jgi:DNA-binding IclR family transcriptional regulator